MQVLACFTSKKVSFCFFPVLSFQWLVWSDFWLTYIRSTISNHCLIINFSNLAVHSTATSSFFPRPSAPQGVPWATYSFSSPPSSKHWLLICHLFGVGSAKSPSLTFWSLYFFIWKLSNKSAGGLSSLAINPFTTVILLLLSYYYCHTTA